MSLWDFLTQFFPNKRRRLEALKYKTGIAQRSITANTIKLDAVLIGGKSYDAISESNINAGDLVRVLYVTEEGVLKVEKVLEEKLPKLDDVDSELNTQTLKLTAIDSKSGQNVSVSDNLLLANDPEVAFNYTTYTKVKEIKMFLAGEYRVKFDLKSGQGGVYGRIYKNGSPFGTERNTTSKTYVTFSEDLIFDEGDLCQLYGYTNNNVYGHWEVRNFR